MTKRSYRYFVKPLADETSEEISRVLVSQGISPQESEHTRIMVGDERVERVYEVPYRIITAIGRSGYHRNMIKVYAQEGNGVIRPYTLYGRRNVSRSKEYRQMERSLKK